MYTTCTSMHIVLVHRTSFPTFDAPLHIDVCYGDSITQLAHYLFMCLRRRGCVVNDASTRKMERAWIFGAVVSIVAYIAPARLLYKYLSFPIHLRALGEESAKRRWRWRHNDRAIQTECDAQRTMLYYYVSVYLRNTATGPNTSIDTITLHSI